MCTTPNPPTPTTPNPQPGTPLELSYGHLPRLLTLRRALSILHSRGSSGPRFVSSKQHLVQLCSVALMSLHWYACATWLQSRLLAECGRQSWVATVMNGTFEETTEAWPWPLWARYASSFARALNAVVGGEKVGGTHAEVVMALFGRARLHLEPPHNPHTLHSALTLSLGAAPVCHTELSGVAWLAYFTSNMVTLVNSMNRQEEYARAKIGRVAVFCRHAGISPDLNQRVKARRPLHCPLPSPPPCVGPLTQASRQSC